MTLKQNRHPAMIALRCRKGVYPFLFDHIYLGYPSTRDSTVTRSLMNATFDVNVDMLDPETGKMVRRCVRESASYFEPVNPERLWLFPQLYFSRPVSHDEATGHHGAQATVTRLRTDAYKARVTGKLRKATALTRKADMLAREAHLDLVAA